MFVYKLKYATINVCTMYLLVQEDKLEFVIAFYLMWHTKHLSTT